MRSSGNGKVKTLNELAEESKESIVLFDACAMISPLGKYEGNLPFGMINEKADTIRRSIEFFQEMRGYIEKGVNFSMTSLVFQELGNGDHYCYKKNVKRSASKKSYFEKFSWDPGLGQKLKEKDILMLRRAIRDKQKEVSRLKESFRENFKVISLEEDFREANLYGHFKQNGRTISPRGVEREEYFYFKEKYGSLQRMNGLSNPDLDFLVTGASLAESGKRVILVSNDEKIRESRDFILEFESFDKQDLKFYKRTDFFGFEERIPYKSLV